MLKDTNKLWISEVFCSIQGESSYTGFSTIFIRLSGCNLRCSICDTKYALKKGRFLSIGEIMVKIKSLKISHVCITGGEPLIQKKALVNLIKELHKNKRKISIETNGSILVDKIPSYAKKVLDVKTPSTKEKDSFNLNNLKYLTKNDELKFVISDKKDFDFSLKFINKNKAALSKIKILFSPNMATKDIPIKLSKWIITSGLDIIFQPQIHKLIKEEPMFLIK